MIIEWLTNKIINLRILMKKRYNNRSLSELTEIALVSQFTLQASTVKGNRPSYIHAAKPEISIPLYERFCSVATEKLGKPVKTGWFGANMNVELLNDGPVTIWIDSKHKE